MASAAGSFGAFRQQVTGAAHKAAAAAKQHGGTAFNEARSAYKAAGGARGVAGGVTDWAKDAHRQYRDVHSNQGSFKDYVRSDSAKATARSAAGSSINTMLKRRMDRAAKKGGFVSQTLWNFAHLAFQGTMRSLKDDQRVFANVAKIRRGDPDVGQLTHNELREVRTHAHKYGGKDKDAIHAATEAELTRRQVDKATEHAKYDIHRRQKLDEARMGHEQATSAGRDAHAKARKAEREAGRAQRQQSVLDHREKLHQQKMRHAVELRQTAGHGAAAKAATDQTIKRAKAPVATGKPKEALQVVGKTKKGNLKVKTKTGKERVATQQEVAKSRSGGSTRSSGGVQAPRLTRRR